MHASAKLCALGALLVVEIEIHFLVSHLRLLLALQELHGDQYCSCVASKYGKLHGFSASLQTLQSWCQLHHQIPPSHWSIGEWGPLSGLIAARVRATRSTASPPLDHNPTVWEVQRVRRRERSVALHCSTTTSFSQPREDESLVGLLPLEHHCSVDGACSLPGRTSPGARVAWSLTAWVGRRGLWPRCIMGEDGDKYLLHPVINYVYYIYKSLRGSIRGCM